MNNENPMNQQPQQNTYQNQKIPSTMIPGNSFCVTSLTLGIISTAMFLLLLSYGRWINVALDVLAIIFGILGLVKKKNDPKAIVGIVLAVISLGFAITFMITGTYINGTRIG